MQAPRAVWQSFMGPIELIYHLLNFAAPAIFVACLLAIVAPWFSKKRPGWRTVFVVAAINSVAGVLVLAVGLWFFGRDGKMASYAALVLVCATAQWLAARR